MRTFSVLAAVGFIVVAGGVASQAAMVTRGEVTFTAPERATTTVVKPRLPEVEHIKTPAAVKALYMSQCAASSQSFRDHLFDIADNTEINAIVVDLKDYSGAVGFPSKTALPGGAGCRVSDFRELVKAMHEHDIYVIGRMTVFQDPLYTEVHPEGAVKRESDPTQVWRDHKGLAFVDVGYHPFWEYIVGLSKEAHEMGVDEINFDYIRYPSDGNMQDTHYQHSDYNHRDVELERFFSYLASELGSYVSSGHTPVRSADVFGMTTTNYDDLTIGQVLERTLPYFDFVAPMTYPSHYPPGFNGYGNPNNNVYGVIEYSLSRAIPRTEATTTRIASFAYERIGTSTPAEYKKPAYDRNKLRLWIQDFDYGGNYGPEEVRAQIQAVYDQGLDSWMLWDPANKYTRDALHAQ